MRGIWDVDNASIIMICVLSLSSGLSGTMGAGDVDGFGRALIALCMSWSGEDGVALRPKPCV